MTKEWKSIWLNATIGVVTGCAIVLFSNWTGKNSRQREVIESKLKTDIKIEVREEIKPELEKKLDKNIFEAHLETQKVEYKSLYDLLEKQNQKLDLAVKLLQENK